MILVAIAILVGVFFVATGRGGELAYEHADHAPLDLGPVGATDVALLRPPTALWGYNMQVTDQALEHIAQAVRDRDVTIAFLQQRLADLNTRDTPGIEPAEAPWIHQAQHARPAETDSAHPRPAETDSAYSRPAEPSDPPASEYPADPPGAEHPADPPDSALAAEEQSR
jgi:hypothetical protein